MSVEIEEGRKYGCREQTVYVVKVANLCVQPSSKLNLTTKFLTNLKLKLNFPF